ncbi:3-deoxy-D-manno-octulosonic acid transferase [Methylacidiphilum caldifontis]|uniref:3-deoxy-D-manno-octulosonic acid transferase n=1 Tax=Methylacidiphilum caldifontis TaxID=2795386 RepID=UPI001A8F53C1|nr:3-deoxy-D-manno-octulosonic acid transferase [Methylacidiphilum caldifontis]QSR88454.1 3-deoxy-D-manno-octulosonic acid transferase [Methylacidiphilum caldifontis]
MRSFFIRLLYSLLFCLFTLFCLPYYYLKLRRRGNPFEGIGQRFGLYPKHKIHDSVGVDIWIHGVSVGEVMIGKVILKELWKLNPEIKVAFSTTTSTGYRMALSEPREKCSVFYFPLDFPWAVKRTFSFLNPKLVVLIETEIWPNFIEESKKRKVPIILCNARLSERTEKWYTFFSWFMKPFLNELSLILVTHELEIERFVKVGFPPERIFCLGSMKFDVANYRSGQEKTLEWWQKMGWDQSHLIILGGSTHRGEEEILLKEFIRLKQHWPNLRLILAPRHAERAKEIKNLCQKYGFMPVMRSDLDRINSLQQSSEILIINTTGELRALYEKADLVFVGKSLTAKGGQNFIEAAKAGKAIIVGPNMQNFKLLFKLFVDCEALTVVKDEADLSSKIEVLLKDEKLRKMMGEKARSVFIKNVGVGRKTAEILYNYLEYQKKGSLKSLLQNGLQETAKETKYN